MKHILLRLCGYRRYRFELFTGQKVTLWGKTRGQAIQKALDIERRIRINRERIKNDTLNTLHSNSVPDELVQNVLGGPDRSAIAG